MNPHVAGRVWGRHHARTDALDRRGTLRTPQPGGGGGGGWGGEAGRR
jgi:hypothetical protein